MTVINWRWKRRCHVGTRHCTVDRKNTFICVDVSPLSKENKVFIHFKQLLYELQQGHFCLKLSPSTFFHLLLQKGEATPRAAPNRTVMPVNTACLFCAYATENKSFEQLQLPYNNRVVVSILMFGPCVCVGLRQVLQLQRLLKAGPSCECDCT